MLEGLKERMRARYTVARVRETKFLMGFDLSNLNVKLTLLLSVFVGLTFLDTLTTLVAINAGPSFVESNPIASRLFQHDFLGFVAALVLKYFPIIPLVYA